LLLFGFDSPREAKQGTGREMSTNPKKNSILVLLPKVAIFANLIAHFRRHFFYFDLIRQEVQRSR